MFDRSISTVAHVDPEVWAAVQAEPARVKGAFEEALRLGSPQQIVYRTVKEDMEFEGYQLAAGAKVAMFLGAANRDPRQWTDPDKYDVSRNTTGIHLALGNGIHVCLGQMLARLEGECILSAIVRRARSMSPAGTPSYRLMNQVRALRNLPLDIAAT